MNDSTRITVVVTAPHKHEGRWRTIGDRYETTESNARDLVAIGYAVRARVYESALYERRDMRPRK